MLLYDCFMYRLWYIFSLPLVVGILPKKRIRLSLHRNNSHDSCLFDLSFSIYYLLPLPLIHIFILPIVNICVDICVIFALVRQQALITSHFPLWLRITLYLLPLLIALFVMCGVIVRRYVTMKHTTPFKVIVLRLFLFFLISMLIILLGTVYLAQEYVIFYPNSSVYDTNHLMQSSAYERVNIDGKYRGWLKKADESDHIIIYFGGNAQNTSTLFTDYEQNGVFTILKNDTFLSVDYPTYGDSDGKLSEKELFTMAEEVVAYAKHHYPDKKIIIIGYSIGTGIAAHTAAVSDPDAFILLAPYNNGKDLFNSYLSLFYGPLQYLIRYPLTSDVYVSKIHSPTLVIYSKNDTIVKAKLTERLLPHFTKKPEIARFDALSHGELAMNTEVWKTIETFIKKQLSPT